jgi:hypothetical protein
MIDQNQKNVPPFMKAGPNDRNDPTRRSTSADFDEKFDAIEAFLGEVRDEFHWRLAGSKVGQMHDDQKFEFMVALYLTAFRDLRREFSASPFVEETDLAVN